MITFGKFRHLQQCSTSEGVMVVLAIDHRANLVSELQKQRAITDTDVVAFKTTILDELSPFATAVLTDPDYGFPGIAAGAVPGNVGILAPLEVTDYNPHPSQRKPTLIPNWDVEKIKMNGCSGAKLLIYFHPEADDAAEKTTLVEHIAEQCQRYQVPLFLEPILYSLDTDKPLHNAERLDLAVATAHHFSRHGADILKLEFPVDVKHELDEIVWRKALEQLSSACKVPWTLLSAGVAFDIFLRQTELACQAGACGVIAGRAIWGEAVALEGAARQVFLHTTGQERMKALYDVCMRYAVSWEQKITPPELSADWY